MVLAESGQERQVAHQGVSRAGVDRIAPADPRDCAAGEIELLAGSLVQQRQRPHIHDSNRPVHVANQEIREVVARRARPQESERLRNGIDGIDAVVGSGVRYVGNHVSYNDENGINDSGDGTVWRRNTANHNGAVGLRADGPGHIDAGGNQARGNGEQDCIGIRCR